MRARFTPLVTQQNQLMVVIMGGDGSLGQTIRELRKTAIIDEHINKITFCLLPFGTGNDTGQVFGWGSKYFPFHEINTF
jgi:diacylglycerol kinase family enzyme